MSIFHGRHSAALEGDFVVLLLGMRINKPWKPHRWLPIVTAMSKMIGELRRDPDSGFLGATPCLFMTGPTVIQYWRSFEHLERYARNPDAQHLPAWRAFNQRVRDSGDVGIWHETYRVRAGDYEAIYVNMPRLGLANVAEHMPLGSTTSAARRLGERPADEPPIPGY